MSKYSLKLEQLVQTTSLGDILVTIQYDGEGPKLVSASGDSLSAELKHLLDTVLGLVNFTLAKKIAPIETAEQLEITPHDGVKLEIDDVLMVIAQALKEAPNSIGQINPDTLMQIMPEMIKEITQGVQNNQDENQSILQSSSNNHDDFAQAEPRKMQNEEVKDEEMSEPEEDVKEDDQDLEQKPQQQNEQEEEKQTKPHEKGGFFGGFGARN